MQQHAKLLILATLMAALFTGKKIVCWLYRLQGFSCSVMLVLNKCNRKLEVIHQELLRAK